MSSNSISKVEDYKFFRRLSWFDILYPLGKDQGIIDVGPSAEHPNASLFVTLDSDKVPHF